MSTQRTPSRLEFEISCAKKQRQVILDMLSFSLPYSPDYFKYYEECQWYDEMIAKLDAEYKRIVLLDIADGLERMERTMKNLIVPKEKKFARINNEQVPAEDRDNNNRDVSLAYKDNQTVDDSIHINEPEHDNNTDVEVVEISESYLVLKPLEIKVQHYDFIIPKWFYEVKDVNDLSQLLPKVHVQRVWSPIRGLWILLHYKTRGRVFFKGEENDAEQGIVKLICIYFTLLIRFKNYYN